MFLDDPRSERFLDSLGAKWRYANDIIFDHVDPHWDQINLGRSVIQIPSAVAEYGALMDAGSAAPAPIIWLNPETGFYEVLDGVQRMLAEEIRKPASFSAYVVITDSIDMVKKIRVFANYRIQGNHCETAEWTLGRVVELLVNTGVMTIEEASTVGGWTISQVRDKKHLMDYGEAIQAIGGPEHVPDVILRLIAKNTTIDDMDAASQPIACFINDIRKMRLTAAEADPYIEQFFLVQASKGKLYTQYQKKLKEFRDDDDVKDRLADPSRHRRQAMSAEMKIRKALRSAITTCTSILEAGDTVPNMEEFFTLNNAVARLMTQIQAMSRKKGRK